MNSRNRDTAHAAEPSQVPDAREASLIGRVADTTAQRDRDALDGSVVGLLQEFLQAQSVALYRLSEEEGQPSIALHAFALAGAREPVVATPRDAASFRPAIDENSLQECLSRREWMQAERDGRVVCFFPVEERGTVCGAVEVCMDIALSARDARLVQGVLRILSNQLALLDYGERDTLTGLLNRKTFEGRVHKLAAGQRAAGAEAASPGAGSSWLGILDVDHFKRLNDQHGHLFGDEVLLLVSQIMKQTFRGADELFRLGGEEFVVLLAQADEQGARIAFERLRSAIERFAFPQSVRVTASIGYTRILPHDMPTACVERADAALYYAKNNGRNNVRLHEDLVQSGALDGRPKEGDVELF